MTESTKPMMVASLWVIVVLIILTCTGCTRQVYTPSVSPAKDAPAKLEASARTIEEIATVQLAEAEDFLCDITQYEISDFVNFLQSEKLRAGQLLAVVGGIRQAAGEVRAANEAIKDLSAELDKANRKLADVEARIKSAARWEWLGIGLFVIGIAGLIARYWIQVIPLAVSLGLMLGGPVVAVVARSVYAIPNWVIWVAVAVIVGGIGYIGYRDNVKKLSEGK